MFGGFGFFGAEQNMPARFEKDYCCYPVAFLGRDDMEQGNRIFLPPSALELLGRLHIQYPMLFEIMHAPTQMRTHCGVLEFVGEEGCVYLPFWMMQQLAIETGQTVRVTNVTLPKGTYVKLQPCTQDFLEVSNPRAVLENALRNYATLTKGDNISIQYNGKTYEIEIADTKPSNAISIVETDLNVDFAPPKDYVAPAKKTDGTFLNVPSSSGAGASASASASQAGTSEAMDVDENKWNGPTVFHGSGNRIDGKAIKHGGPAVPICAKTKQQLSPEEILHKQKPWLKRIPGGVRREKPYGYDQIIVKKLPGIQVPGKK